MRIAKVIPSSRTPTSPSRQRIPYQIIKHKINRPRCKTNGSTFQHLKRRLENSKSWRIHHIHCFSRHELKPLGNWLGTANFVGSDSDIVSGGEGDGSPQISSHDKRDRIGVSYLRDILIITIVPAFEGERFDMGASIDRCQSPGTGGSDALIRFGCTYA